MTLELFPSYWELAKYGGIAWAIGPGCLLLTFLLWVKLRDLRPVKWCLLVTGGASTLLVYAMVLNAQSLRVPHSEIVELEVSRLPSEQHLSDLHSSNQKPQGVAVSFTGAAAQGAWQLLATSKARPMDKETFFDGYELRFKVRGEPNFRDVAVLAYRRSSTLGRVNVVVPVVSWRFGGMAASAGEYSSPELHRWLVEEVEPLLEQASSQ